MMIRSNLFRISIFLSSGLAFGNGLQLAESQTTINQVKNNQLLLLVIILFFVLGMISLFFYSKKIKIANKQLDFLSKENAFLLNEANHRINNNLQLIVILISDELRKLNGNESLNVKKILSKVESIATLHRHLYQSKNKNEIEISNYLNEIKVNFEELFEEKAITVNFHTEERLVSIDQGLYLGLLLTELFINTLKYAFKEQANREIEVKVSSQKSSGYRFIYKDNGQSSIGLDIKPRLVDKLCRQLKVVYTINTQEGFELSFDKEMQNEQKG